MARLQIRRYIWLIDIVRSAGPDGITYEEINRKWHRATLNEDGKDYAWRTFQEDRRIITGEFDIEITCDRRDNTYRIEELDEYGSVRGSLIDALVLNNAIREAPDLNNSIVFNDNFYQECMPGFVRAIKEHRAIRFRYVRQDRIPQLGISRTIDRVVTFSPYGLYNSTLWFTVGKNMADGKLHIYALHRISELEFLDETFTVPVDFSVKQYMSDYWVDDDEPEPYPGREPDDAFTLERFEAGKSLDLKI